MNVVNMAVGSPFPVTIGFAGENDVQQVIFDYSAWQKLFGDGALTLVIVRPTECDAYPVALEAGADPDTAVWTVSEADTAYRGSGRAQLIYAVDEQIKKSAIFDIYVDRSIMSSVEPPDPYQTWLDQMIAVRDGAVQAAGDAAESATAAGQSAADTQQSAEAAAESADQAESIARETAEEVVNSKVDGQGLALSVSSGIATLTF